MTTLDTTIGSLDLDGPSSGAGSQLLQWLQPAVTTDTIAGPLTVAPYGSPGRGNDWKGAALVGGVLLGALTLGFILGRASA